MLIDMNGMYFHLNLANAQGADGFRAEIVDEAFNFEVQRDTVTDLDGVAAFIRRYAGLSPKAGVLSQVAKRLEVLYQTRDAQIADVSDGPNTLAQAG